MFINQRALISAWSAETRGWQDLVIEFSFFGLVWLFTFETGLEA